MAQSARVFRWTAAGGTVLCMALAPLASARADAVQQEGAAATDSSSEAAPPPAEAALMQPSVDPDPTQEALLSAVRAIESTAFGQWLREHPVAWNAIAFASIVVLALALSVVISRMLRAVVRATLVRAHKDALAAAIDAGKLYGILGLMPALLLAARALGVLGSAELVHPLVGLNAANLLVAAVVVVSIVLFGRLLTVADELYSARPQVNRKGALAGYRQVAMVPVALVGIVAAAAIAVGKSPIVFLAAIGALATVLGVVFKDFIISLAANLMLSANDAIRVGDWVELKQHSIDGRIAEIKTTAVRVQNADGTVHTVPISRFVQEPYRNFRSKYGSPGRRVRRSIRIDARSIRTLSAEEVAALERSADGASIVARARAMTPEGAAVSNLACFRAEVEASLARDAAIDASLPIALTQGDPDPSAPPAGIALDLLCFLQPAPFADLAAREGAILDRMVMRLPDHGLRGFQSVGDLPGLAAPLPTAPR
ncbi:MAG: mechanosensitive ion channel [Phycisphaera sp.]|nr:mechanosensitive ion channel [Phycisphaera sp.]